MEEIRVALPHVRQTFTWDCGLACIEMILRSRGCVTVGVTEMIAMIGTKSVWSIDLAYLLKELQIDCRYCTKTIGVTQHSSLEFYQSNLEKDAKRVHKLFSEAAAHGVIVEERVVELGEIKAHLELDNYVIILVDKQYLSEDGLNSVGGDDDNYLGHFIILCAYFSDNDLFEYKDPAEDESSCFIKAAQLEIARKRAGTDEDILFIYHAKPLKK